MKKLRMAICAALSVVCLFGCTGCILPQDPQKSIVIDGEKYVSGFYDRLTTMGNRYLGDNPCLFRTDVYYKWWSYDDTAYKLYCCNCGDSTDGWSPYIYCKKSQFDEVRAYYQSAENFDYYFSTGKGKDNKVKIPDTEDKELLNEFVEYSVKRSISSKYDPFESSGYTTVEYDLETWWDCVQVNTFKISVDGIFNTTYSRGFYYINDQLYALKKSRVVSGASAEDNTKTFYLLEGEKYEYLLSLFKSLALPEILEAKEDKDSALE